MKKGFTLIELLAVIVILAIIGVITVPIIGNVIEESKKQALEASVRGIVEATDYFAISNDGVYEFIFDENNKGVTLKGDSLDYTGSVDAEGKLILDREGNISLCLMNDNYYVYKNYNSGIVIGDRSKDSCNVGYDTLTNKYIAFLESEGSASNVYSKDEVDNLIDNVNTNITNNTNEITNVKNSIETLQNSLNDYALKSELQQTNENMNTLSGIVSGNTTDINTVKTTVEYLNGSMLKCDIYEKVIDSTYNLWHIPVINISHYEGKKIVSVSAWSSSASLVVPYYLASQQTYTIFGTANNSANPLTAGTYYLSIIYKDQ